MKDAAKWIKEKQKAIQLGVALHVYTYDSDPNRQFPSDLRSVLECFDHDEILKKRIEGLFLFEDPATKELYPWVYNCQAKSDSSDLLIASPPSAANKRIFLLCDGEADVITEDMFKSRFKSDNP